MGSKLPTKPSLSRLPRHPASASGGKPRRRRAEAPLSSGRTLRAPWSELKDAVTLKSCCDAWLSARGPAMPNTRPVAGERVERRSRESGGPVHCPAGPEVEPTLTTVSGRRHVRSTVRWMLVVDAFAIKVTPFATVFLEPRA